MAKLQTHAGVLAYLSRKQGAGDSYPFGPGARVFKVGGKMFALIGEDEPTLTLNLKCDPEDALALRAAYPKWVRPGYHMNKKHWNTVVVGEGLPDEILREMMDHSYALVFASLPKAVRAKLQE
ncbi:MAG: MmcQ/YjbR family DNA-binding protein [Anaerolineales bacterium]|nr:MmcQ/YjbR family DNA-binding protein [Anaerolineales bacterium]